MLRISDDVCEARGRLSVHEGRCDLCIGRKERGGKRPCGVAKQIEGQIRLLERALYCRF